MHYYAAHRPDRPNVHWQVRIKHDGDAKIIDGRLAQPGQWSQIYALKVHPPRDGEPAAESPAPQDAAAKK